MVGFRERGGEMWWSDLVGKEGVLGGYGEAVLGWRGDWGFSVIFVQLFLVLDLWVHC